MNRCRLYKKKKTVSRSSSHCAYVKCDIFYSSWCGPLAIVITTTSSCKNTRAIQVLRSTVWLILHRNKKKKQNETMPLKNVRPITVYNQIAHFRLSFSFILLTLIFQVKFLSLKFVYAWDSLHQCSGISFNAVSFLCQQSNISKHSMLWFLCNWDMVKNLKKYI